MYLVLEDGLDGADDFALDLGSFLDETLQSDLAQLVHFWFHVFVNYNTL